MSFVEACALSSRADMETVNYLLDSIPDWENVLIRRHVKFVREYEMTERDLRAAGATFFFSEEDMQSVFWRIQKTLLAEYVERFRTGRLSRPSVKPPRHFEAFVRWYVTYNRYEDAEVIVRALRRFLAGEVCVDGVGPQRRRRIEAVLDTLAHVENLAEVLPERYCRIVNDLFNGFSLTDTAVRHGLSHESLVRIIVGRDHPRRPSERGLMAYVGDARRAGTLVLRHGPTGLVFADGEARVIPLGSKAVRRKGS